MSNPLPPQGPESQKQEHNPAGQCEKPGDKPDLTGRAITPSPSGAPPSPTNSVNPNNEKDSARHGKAQNIEIGMFILEFVGIVGLGYYCWVNHRELVVFDSERVTMESEFRTSQSNAMAQLDEMRKAREGDQRAWLGISQTTETFTTNPTNGERLTVTFNAAFKNTGRTPALNVVPVIGECTDVNSIPQKDQFPNPVYHSFLVPPDGGGNVTATYGLTSAATNCPIIKIDRPFYLAGTIWYDDIFGRHHWTQFCILIQPDFNSAPTPPVHNTCDDAQASQPN